MPELPEVETIRRDLLHHIVNKKIRRLEILRSSVVKGGASGIEQGSQGGMIKNIERYGKMLVFVLDKKNKFLLIHLKMTGQLIYQMKSCVVAGGHVLDEADVKILPNKHTQLIFHFIDDTRLYFNDMRRFGYVKLVSGEEKDKAVAKYGIDALDKKFTVKKLEEIAKQKTGNIKALLMNQEKIAGIGNIYAAEICFGAGVRPDRKVNTLEKGDYKKIVLCIKKILRLAIKHRGTTFSDYRDCEGRRGNFVKYLKVYGRKKEKCLVCGTQLKSQRLAGRGTVFCPKCQK